MRNRLKIVITVFVCLFLFSIQLTSKAEGETVLLTRWQITQSFPADKIDLEAMKYPRFYTIFLSNWQSVTPEPSGLVDISRWRKHREGGPDVVLARTIIHAPRSKKIRLSFRYADEAAMFLNGSKVFYGAGAGSHDPVDLTLEKGRNEILLAVKEVSGGWEFMARAGQELPPPVKDHAQLKKVWQTPKSFLTPESVCYDKKRRVLYVSNFDNKYNPKAVKEQDFSGYISKVKLNGEIQTLKWVTPLHAPCGMCIVKDRLFTVERKNLTEIDIKSGKVVKRYPIPGADFPNDIAADSKGNIYISDTSPKSHIASRIYKYAKGKVEVWLDTLDIWRANGLFVHRDKLLVGNSGDARLKAVNLADKHVSVITCLGAGIIDGIRVDNNGNYLVSHWEGWTYSISPTGQVKEILDTQPIKVNSADFEFVKEQNLLIIPTFLDNRVMAYRLDS
jgi:sugar lactone lactonase YvrE